MPKPKDKEKIEQPEKIERSQVEEIKVETKTDEFSNDERKDIVKMVKDDVDYGIEIQADYISQKALDIKHYHGESPSVLEGLSKKEWMSDRNLGLARAVADSYQATLLATCWNPDTISFIATRTFDINNRTNQEKFTKWGMGKQESDTKPEVDGFIHNRVITGSSFFKIYRKIWNQWVDRRIPKKNRDGKTTGFEIKTEKQEFIKGLIENIPDIDDILMPEYGKSIQDLPFFIQRLHLDGESVLALIKKGTFKPKDKEPYKKKLYSNAYQEEERELGSEKLKQLGVTLAKISDLDIRRLPITLYEWYGLYTKGGKTEKYRFIVDTENDELLSGKPLRKINRSGKVPFAGGALCREPGMLRGVSLMQIVAPVVNAFNNVFNQKSDFQYVTNCPFGFHNPEEGYQKQAYELEPMISYPVAGKPSDSVYFPNLQRSMAWAESDIRILFEVLERLTGAASYFTTRTNQSKTLGQDLLIDKNSETRFGLWASRIMEDICEAIGMWFELYQDYPPKGLAERVLGPDGKQLFPEGLTVETLMGEASVQMTPDIVAGSKTYRKQIMLWAFGAAQQMVWLNPQINPSGNWELCADTLQEMLNLSESEVERYLGKKPKAEYDETEIDNEWQRFMRGESFEPPEGETQLAIQHLKGHTKQKEEKYHELPEEARPGFEAHYFRTIVNAMNLIKNAQREAMATKMASQAIVANQGQNAQPGAPVAQPGAMPGAMPGAQLGQPPINPEAQGGPVA